MVNKFPQNLILCSFVTKNQKFQFWLKSHNNDGTLHDHSGFESQKAFQPKLLIVLFYVLFVCKCVLYYCHWVPTQLQLIYIYIHKYQFIFASTFSTTTNYSLGQEVLSTKVVQKNETNFILHTFFLMSFTLENNETQMYQGPRTVKTCSD